MDETTTKFENLMFKWKEAHAAKGWHSFISDGAVNAKIYEASSPKICFFLKEAYSRSDNDSWSLTKWLADGAMTRMWGAVAEWSYGLMHTTKTYIPAKPNLSTSEKTKLLHSVAIVNVKKSNGNVRSDYDDLLKYAIVDKDNLKQELDILKPDVIVCGNNSSLLRLLYGASIDRKGRVATDGQIDYEFMQKNGFVLVGNQIIIDYWHPANQYPAIMNYYTICGLYQQALKATIKDCNEQIGVT